MNRYGIIQNEKAEAAARPQSLPFRAAENAQKTHKHKSESSGAATPLPPVGGKPKPPRQVQALLAAGRLLQSRDWPGGKVPIKRLAGESYPDAVARTITGLEPAGRDKLRDLTRWVMDYEDTEAAG